MKIRVTSSRGSRNIISLPCSKQSIKIKPVLKSSDAWGVSQKGTLFFGLDRYVPLNMTIGFSGTWVQGTQFRYQKSCVFLDQKPLKECEHSRQVVYFSATTILFWKILLHDVSFTQGWTSIKWPPSRYWQVVARKLATPSGGLP